MLGFGAHFAVAADVSAAWLHERLAPGDLLAPLSAPFLAALGERLGARGDGIDVALAAPGLGGAAALAEIDAAAAHPRVARARGHRDGVRAYEDRSGAAVVVLGRGLAGRREVAVEVHPAARGRSVARRALVEARRLLAPGDALFAQTAPGNAASLRALLAAGFAPIGSEALFFRRTRPDIVGP